MKNRFTSHLVAGALALAGLGCEVGGKQADTHEQDQLSQQNVTIPTGITAATADTYSQQLRDDIAAALVERRSVPVNRPELLPPHLVPDLKVDQNLCEVWVSFYGEGAGQRNALGYFVYPEGSPPSAPLTEAQLRQNIIFPNSSAQGSGGTLTQGTRFRLGSNGNFTFPSGYRVGFYLIANACGSDTNCTAQNITIAGRPVYYSVDSLNPESDPTKKRHALIVSHADSQRLILGFEDLNRTAGAGSDDDFNDVVFTINWSPVTCLERPQPGIDRDSSCQAVKTFNPVAASGFYRLDPCGTNGTQTEIFYCDMTTPGANGVRGGWTVGGWQEASAPTSLGVENRGTLSLTSTNWSRNLSCLPFNEVMVFNRTSGEYFTETLRGAQFRVRPVPFAMGEPGRSFVQGTLGPYPDGLNPMMGCVGYNYQSALSSEWACVTEWYTPNASAKGHIAGFALDLNCNPALDSSMNNWAWANNSTCTRVDQPYTWGFGIR